MKRIVLTICVIISLSTVAYADYFKCVTSNGKTIFTDSPPPDAKCEFKEKINSFSETPEYVNSMREEADYQIQINDAKRAKVAEEKRVKDAEVRIANDAAAERELDAKNLELKQRELDLKEREINANANLAPNQYVTVIHDTNIINVEKHPSRHEDHKQKEQDAKTGKDVNGKNTVSGQTPKNINEKKTVKAQQITPSQPPPPQKPKKMTETSTSSTVSPWPFAILPCLEMLSIDKISLDIIGYRY